MSEVPDDTIQSVNRVADTLDRHGHPSHADALRLALARGHAGSVFLTTLRETCQIILTAIEAIDPVCATLIEELRLQVDGRLTEEHSSATGA